MPTEIIVKGRSFIDKAFFLYWIPLKNRKVSAHHCTLVLLSDIVITVEEFKEKGKNHVVYYLTSVMAIDHLELLDDDHDLPASSFFLF